MSAGCMFGDVQLAIENLDLKTLKNKAFYIYDTFIKSQFSD